MLTVSSPQVLISGAGPTGIAAALELRRFGIPVRIIEAQEGPSKTSRAIGVQARTLEELELRGLASEFVRLGNPAKGGTIYGDGRQLLRLDFTRIESRYNFLLLLSEADTERIMREALAREGTRVEFGVKMVAFAQNAEGITATLEHTGGRLEEISAAYLIDAEGAHSLIRTSLNLEFKGKTLDEHYALGDLHVDGDLPVSDLHIFSSEYGFMGLFPLGGSHFRLIASNPPGDPSEQAGPTLDQLQAIYDQRAHIPARLRQLGWSSWFHINSRMVDRLKIGRVFLGGDAAHIHSPAAAQGMNTGIQDMLNLVWKLALVLKGQANEELLDTYQQDRFPVMRSIVARTEEMTELIEAKNPLVRGLFNHLTPWIGGLNFVEENATARISQLALNYRESALSADQAAGGSLRAGDRVPELHVRAVVNLQNTGRRVRPEYEEGRLFSLLNPTRFTLLVANLKEASSLSAQLANVLEPWRQLIAVVQVEASSIEPKKKFREYFGTIPSLILVRPDAYIAFRGNEHSVTKLAEYLRHWLSPGAHQRAA
jgi:2-polyprenyl-6-methoxyphenol hydroxylase-like FAD-dependent oxidoreductase